jgi:LPXTG-site transpeptidase (sortase) family protein
MASQKGLIGEIAQRRVSFSLAFVGIFVLSVLFLSSVGATPDPIHPDVISDEPSTQGALAEASTTPEIPLRIAAADISLSARINNPASTDLDTLDNALLTGAVRYPTSAMLGQDGTVLLFGHSSYLPIVHNLSYKTFDDIQKLKPGEIVSVYSATTEYRYAVTEVRVANANEDSIELQSQGKHLVLVTCDSFASKSNRFIVTADFVGAYAIQ